MTSPAVRLDLSPAAVEELRDTGRAAADAPAGQSEGPILRLDRSGLARHSDSP